MAVFLSSSYYPSLFFYFLPLSFSSFFFFFSFFRCSKVELENEEMVEYLNKLHEAIIVAYTGIVLGLADGDATAVLLQVTTTGRALACHVRCL